MKFVFGLVAIVLSGCSTMVKPLGGPDLARTPASAEDIILATKDGSRMMIERKELLAAISRMAEGLVRSDPPGLNGDKSIQFNNPAIFYNNQWYAIGTESFSKFDAPMGTCKLLVRGMSSLAAYEYQDKRDLKDVISLNINGDISKVIEKSNSFLKSVSCRPY